jgi:hypothetical protein
MVYMPETAIAMTLGLLLIICVFVAHTMLSRRSDSRLGFLLDFMRDAEEQSGRPSSVGSSPCPAENTGTEKFLEATTPVGREAKQHVSQRSWWEEPLLLPTLLPQRDSLSAGGRLARSGPELGPVGHRL